MGKSKEVAETTKTKVTETVKTTARITKNAEQLVVASALLITTIFAYTQVKTITNKVWYYMVLVSLIIVGLLAFSQLVKFLNRD